MVSGWPVLQDLVLRGNDRRSAWPSWRLPGCDDTQHPGAVLRRPDWCASVLLHQELSPGALEKFWRRPDSVAQPPEFGRQASACPHLQIVTAAVVTIRSWVLPVRISGLVQIYDAS